MKLKLTCRAYLWLCCYGNPDSDILSLSKIAWDHIWWLYRMAKNWKIFYIWLPNPYQHSKLCWIQIFCDDDAIDDVIVRLWNSWDFRIRQIVGFAGDNIMYRILLLSLCLFDILHCVFICCIKSSLQIHMKSYWLEIFVYDIHVTLLSLAPLCQSAMMTSSNGNIFRVTGHLCGEFTGPRWIPHTKASDAELWCLLWSAPE